VRMYPARAPQAIGLPAAAGAKGAGTTAGRRGRAGCLGVTRAAAGRGRRGRGVNLCARVRVYVPVAVWWAAAQAECRAWLALLLGCTEAHARQHTRLHTGYMAAPAFRWVGVAGG